MFLIFSMVFGEGGYDIINFFFLKFQEVVDESDGCGGKFSAVIVSSQFEGKSLLQKHRLVFFL